MATGENNGERIRALEVAIEGYDERFGTMDLAHGKLADRVQVVETWKTAEQAGSAAVIRLVSAICSGVVMVLTIAKMFADYLARAH